MPNPSKLSLDMLSLKQKEQLIMYYKGKIPLTSLDIDRIDELGNVAVEPKPGKKKVEFK